MENNSIQDIALAKAEGKTLAQKAEEFVNEQNKQYKQKHCAGLTATACSGQMYKERQEFLNGGGSLTLDFIPIIGDIKGFDEAQTFGDYFFASVGLIPIVGDAAKSYHKAQKAYDVAEKAGDVAGMKVAMNDAVKACSGGACFTAGTLIETDQGLKAVEKFEGGELVWARNDTTLEYGYRPVIATKVTAEQAIFEVVIQNQVGQTEILETTAEHPFWIKNFGWLKASLLQSGMILLDRNNEELTIVSQVLIPNKLETVYNIEVDGFHTYHVGELGIWVHNADCCINAKEFNGKMLGIDGVQTFSTTVWKGNGKSRIDVENPSPGKRAGQLHYQDNTGNKYYYDPNMKVFFNQKTNELAPKSVQNLLKDKGFSNGIDKALNYLGVNK